MSESSGDGGITSKLADAFREDFAREWPRVVGATLRAFGDLELAEDSAQEAFLRAHSRIAEGDTITNLGAWVTTSARRIAIDSLRRDTVLRSKLPVLAATELTDVDDAESEDAASARLGLIAVACNPALSEEAQIALALRIVCGIPTVDIADFFGIAESTIAARLTRARKALFRAGVPFEWPSDVERTRRLGHVLTTIYGIYTLGHTAPRGRALIDSRLTELALSLAESLLTEYPRETEVLGLKALIVLGEARQPSRIGVDGIPVVLADADRSAWGQLRIREGLALAARALPGGGRFALQAGIAGIHSSASTWEDTDWASIATLYHGLKRVWPAPVVQLGSIIARSHRGPHELNRAADELCALRRDANPELQRRISAAVADVEERRGNLDAARQAIAEARVGEPNEALHLYYAHAEKRLAELDGFPPSPTSPNQ